MSELGSVEGWPVTHPAREVLEAAELVTTGVLDALPAGLPVPPPVDAPGVVLEDAEGTPVAALHSGGRVEPLRPFGHGPLRGARRPPHDVRAALQTLPATDQSAAASGHGPTPAAPAAGDSGAGAGGPGRAVVAVPVGAALTVHDVTAAVARARADGAVLLWLALVGAGRRRDLPPEALWRAVRATAAEAGVPGLAVPVAVPALPDPAADAELVERVAAAYGATAVQLPPDRDHASETTLHRSSARELAAAVPPPHERGVTVF